MGVGGDDSGGAPRGLLEAVDADLDGGVLRRGRLRGLGDRGGGAVDPGAADRGVAEEVEADRFGGQDAVVTGDTEPGEAAALGGDGLGRVVARGGIDEAGAFLPPGAVELDMGGLTPTPVSPIEEWRDVTLMPPLMPP